MSGDGQQAAQHCIVDGTEDAAVNVELSLLHGMELDCIAMAAADLHAFGIVVVDRKPAELRVRIDNVDSYCVTTAHIHDGPRLALMVDAVIVTILARDYCKVQCCSGDYVAGWDLR